jgi:hypothetical protein
MVDLHARRLNPRSAAGLAQLSNVLMRAIEVTNFEARIKKLEETSRYLLDDDDGSNKAKGTRHDG